MISILVHVKNYLLRQSIELALSRTGDFIIEIEKEEDADALISKLEKNQYDILFMDIARSYPYSYEEREKIIRRIHQLNVKTRIAMYCDSNSEKEMADKVKELKNLKMIDAFFYESVDDKYMVAILETL